MVIHMFQKNSYNTLSRSLQKISLKKCKFGCFLYSNFSFQSMYLFQLYRQSIKFSLSCKATLYLILGLCNAQVNCKIILHCRKNVTWCGASWQTFFVCLAILLWQLIEKDVSLLIILRTFFLPYQRSNSVQFLHEQRTEFWAVSLRLLVFTPVLGCSWCVLKMQFTMAPSRL